MGVGATRRMLVCYAPPPRRPGPRSVMRPLRQKGQPSPIRRLVRTQADLGARAQPDADPSLDCARPAGKSVPRTTARAQAESPAELLAARASLADSNGSIVRNAGRFDQFAPQFAVVRRLISFWGYYSRPTYS